MAQRVVLIASDKQKMHSLLMQALSTHDGRVLVAVDGAQAIAALNEHPVSVVILDGPLARIQDVALYTRRARPQVPIVALLAQDEAASAGQAALDVDDFLVKPLSPDAVRLAVARAIELRRLKHETEWLARVSHIGHQVASIVDSGRLLSEAAPLVQQSFDFYYVGIALPEEGAEVGAAVGGEPDSSAPVKMRCALTDRWGVRAQVLHRQEPLLIADLRGQSRYTLPAEFSKARSAVIVPLAFQGRSLGALEVLSAEPHAFKSGDLPLFESLTAHIAVAMHNAHLFEAQQERQQTLHALYAAAVAMQRVITSQTRVLEVMARELDRFGFVSLVHLLDPSSGCASLCRSCLPSSLAHELTELLAALPGDWPLDVGRAPTHRRALDERRAVYLADIEAFVGEVFCGAVPDDQVPSMAQMLGRSRAVVAPMLSGDRAIGWLTVFSPRLDADDRPAIMAFASQVVVALDNARLLADTCRAVELALLNEAGQAMAATLDFDEVLQLLLQAVAKVVQVDECVVALWDETEGRHVPRAIFTEGRVSLADVFDGDMLIPEPPLPPVRIPLIGHDRMLGLLALDRHTDGSDLGPEDVQLAQALANQAASALDNARLYTRLKRSAEELEESQRQLFHSEKLVVTGRMAASIAHEINNPLQAIKNCLELILDEADAGQPLDRTYLNVATSELERIRRIIQQMLDLYRPSKERMVPIDLNAAVEGVLALMRKQLESHQIDLETHLDSNVPRVIGHDDQIRQVFINLILNASEAMPEGGRIILKTHQDSDDFVTVRVIDNGVGIAPENLSRIADPFFTTKSKGVGLGLSICHEIIERHQGTLDVSSQVGRGSEFSIRLPAAE